jgi:ubiquinone/menaquinone biosynthesis C-methylase UbiE
VSVIKITQSFDGPAGWLTAQVMAYLNRDMELAAVEGLDPAPSDHVLSVGFGAGVGIRAMSRQLSDGLAVGIDPSRAMMRIAARRNRNAIAAGRVELRDSSVEAMPFPDDSFHGMVAVNSIQLWRPLDGAIDEIARTLRPGGTFLAITHAWAIERTTPLDQWTETVTELLVSHRLKVCDVHSQRFRSGQALSLRATLSERASRTVGRETMRVLGASSVASNPKWR